MRRVSGINIKVKWKEKEGGVGGEGERKDGERRERNIHSDSGSLVVVAWLPAKYGMTSGLALGSEGVGASV